MADELACITQGSIGILETVDGSLGLFSEKIESCRVYIFECANATLLVHDTGQIRLQALCDFIANYGEVKAVAYAIGNRTAEQHHHARLQRMAKQLKFRLTVAKPVRIHQNSFAVAYTKNFHLIEAKATYFNVKRDPNEAVREAVNILNDWFTPSNSQSAPLDVQFQNGEFTQPPKLTMSVIEMLKDLRADKKHGLLGASALGHFGPQAGLTLPAELPAFLREHGLSEACYKGLPLHLADKGKAYQQLAEKFGNLPIFG